MARLFRPHIPLSVRCQVAERQLRQADPAYLAIPEKTYGGRLKVLLAWLAGRMGCEVSDLRLDHDPPLAARAKSKWASDGKTHYIPEANSPAHLAYRPHGPEHDGSHLIKTLVRGDHGQHPDRVLIKKMRRIERGPKPKRGPKIKSRGFASKSGAKLRTPKRKWPKRSFK